MKSAIVKLAEYRQWREEDEGDFFADGDESIDDIRDLDVTLDEEPVLRVHPFHHVIPWPKLEGKLWPNEAELVTDWFGEGKSVAVYQHPHRYGVRVVTYRRKPAMFLFDGEDIFELVGACRP